MQNPEGSLIAFFSRKVKKGGGINLAQGRPGFEPPNKLLDILKNKITETDLHQYAPGNGDSRLLDILVKKHSRKIESKRENFLVVQGATEGIFLTFFYLTTIIGKGAGVLSFDPVYESYPKITFFMSSPFHYFDTPEDLSSDPSGFEKVIKEKNIKIIFISSPGNPHGKVWKKSEVELLSEIASDNKAYIIFDAVYSDIYFDEEPFNPMELKKSNIFYVNSFSKMLSITGWRIGYVHSVKEHMSKIRSIHDYTGLCAPYLLQRSIAEFMELEGEADEYISDLREKCKKNIMYISRELSNRGFRIPSINGGYFFWAELPDKYEDGLKFAEDLYDSHKVAVVPGINFSKEKKNYIRINCAVNHSIIKEATKKIISFVKN